ncbi:class I SAM-dependent DNA methyltransferase [Shewanella waksmanii]|uniref:class I SAM-dependent DNA methyltransferase n=1 Tax=Shewanella waksmanii TaxID=213783 RepID=UPI0037364203
MKSEMYSKHAAQYDVAVQDNIYNAHLERPSLQAMLTGVSQAKVLDLGCGSGIYAQYLLAQGASQVTCVDASPEMIELVKQKLGNQVQAYVQDLNQGLPQEADGQYEVILCPLLIHYIENLNLFFAEVSRVLKSGGYVVFSTHHPMLDFECTVSGNYFQQEYVEEVWHTIGEPVAVAFYRRSLTDIVSAVTANGLLVSQLSEGKVDPKVARISPEHYQKLSTQPNFLFMRCHKLTIDS